jgi:streptomycin 6-kinase
MTAPAPIRIDARVRDRLLARFGNTLEPWLDELPSLVAALAERWHLELRSPVSRGSVAVVIRCRAGDGRPLMLKLSPDRERLANEAAALHSWRTPRVPLVLEHDDGAGALLLEGVEPGTSLLESHRDLPPETLAELLRTLHSTGTADPRFPPLRQRVVYLYESWARARDADPSLLKLVSPAIFRRGFEAAVRLAEEPAPTVLLHGDLTPANVLEGGVERGLVAIDPAPCIGDPAFDAVDLLLWRVDDIDAVAARADVVAAQSGMDASRLLAWCAAFAGMAVLDAGSAVDALLKLAVDGPPP